MTHPFKSQAKTGQQIADARYDAVKNKTPESPVMAEARKNPKGQVPDEVYTAAPTRQISNYGNVRK